MNCIKCQERVCIAGEGCSISSSLLDKGDNIQIYLSQGGMMDTYRVTTEIPKNIPRIHEVRTFIQKTGTERVGIAFCKGMIPHMEGILDYLSKDLPCDFYPVICTNNSIKKADLGFEGVEVTCNPLGQGEILNRLNTQLNLAVGLCVGHDILFSSASEAPVTTLVVKDRIYGHCPLEAL